ncbi:unnamed protein product [Parajaminaea phylloscopi]
MARRPAAADRHAMLAAYGYGTPSPQQQPASRGPSPFEQPYASGPAANGSYKASPYHSKKNDDEPEQGSSGSARSAISSWWPAGNSDSRMAEQLEEGNDERLQGLSDRVKILKDITLGIGNEVREGTKDLNSLQEAMSNAGALLNNTFNKMNHMARRQGGWFCNMMLFLLFICWLFVFLWWWRR